MPLCNSPPSCEVNDQISGDASSGALDVFAKLSMKKKSPRFVKCPDDHKPLPDPFPLPTHYREDVERSLKSRSMTQQAKRAFFTAVAGAMLAYKRYPSSKDYHCVYHSITTKFPFLEADTRSQEKAIVKSLQGRFKEFRRPYKPRKAVSSSSEHKAGSSSTRHRSITSTMPVPIGEDIISFERHNRALKVERGKVFPNKQVIKKLMTQSFAMRWNDLHNNTYSLDTVFDKYPFLADVYEIIRDMERATDNHSLLQSSKTAFKNLMPKVMKRGSLEANSNCRLRNKMKDLKAEDVLATLIIMVHLFPEAREKADSNHVIYFTKEATDVMRVAEENNILEPYVIVIGSVHHYSQAFLIINSRLIGEIKDIEMVPVVLLASYYVFNVCYPKGFSAFYAILEVIILKTQLSKTSASVQHAFASIQNN